MKDYLIWVGEKIEAEYPGIPWETIMWIVTHSNHLPERWELNTYIKEMGL